MLCGSQLIHLYVLYHPDCQLQPTPFFSPLQTLQHTPTLMASTTPKPLKQLGQLLQEQQEPFILEAYLLEKGYLKKSLNSEGDLACCHGNSTKLFKRSASCRLNKSRNRNPAWSKILKTVCKKLVSIKENQKMKNSENGNGQQVAQSENEEEKSSVTGMDGDGQEEAESVRFSSASSTTVFNSCSESDKEETSTSSRKEAATDRKFRQRCTEDNKQLSPVSVLEEIPSYEDIILTSFPSDLQGLVCPNLSPQLLKSKTKRVLQQTKQLLFDCVREVVEIHARKKSSVKQNYRKFLGPEELGKLICEKMKEWGKRAGDEANMNYLLNLDFMDSVEEWNDFEQQKKEIALKIGDAILEEITNEVVTVMAPNTC